MRLGHLSAVFRRLGHQVGAILLQSLSHFLITDLTNPDKCKMMCVHLAYWQSEVLEISSWALLVAQGYVAVAATSSLRALAPGHPYLHKAAQCQVVVVAKAERWG